MLMRWFVVAVSDDSADCIIVGNCKTRELANICIAAVREQSDRNFKVIGPITQNMLEGRISPEDIELVEAQLEHIAFQQSGRRTH